MCCWCFSAYDGFRTQSLPAAFHCKSSQSSPTRLPRILRDETSPPPIRKRNLPQPTDPSERNYPNQPILPDIHYPVVHTIHTSTLPLPQPTDPPYPFVRPESHQTLVRVPHQPHPSVPARPEMRGKDPLDEAEVQSITNRPDEPGGLVDLDEIVADSVGSDGGAKRKVGGGGEPGSLWSSRLWRRWSGVSRMRGTGALRGG